MRYTALMLDLLGLDELFTPSSFYTVVVLRLPPGRSCTREAVRELMQKFNIQVGNLTQVSISPGQCLFCCVLWAAKLGGHVVV